MPQEMEFEFRNREFPIMDLFHIYENPEPNVLNHACYLVKDGKAKLYHEKNNNLMPTRFEFVLVPKYETWEDKPDDLNIVIYQQAMALFELILNYAIEKLKNSSPMAPSIKEFEVFTNLKLQVPVSLLDPEEIDSVHMANMYRKYGQDF